MKIISYLNLILIFFLLYSCNRSQPSKPIIELLNLREQALETENLELYSACLSEHYQDEEKTREILLEKAQKLFDDYDQIEFNFKNRSLYLEKDNAEKVIAAEVVQEYLFQAFNIKLGEMVHGSGQERLQLVLEDDANSANKPKFKIVAGL